MFSDTHQHQRKEEDRENQKVDPSWLEHASMDSNRVVRDTCVRRRRNSVGISRGRIWDEKNGERTYMPGVGGKWTWGVGGNGMPLGVEGDNPGVPIAPGEFDGTWGQEPYAWERWARGREEEDLREGRGRGWKVLWATWELMMGWCRWCREYYE